MGSVVCVTGPKRKGVPSSAKVRFQKSIASCVAGNLGSCSGVTTTIVGTFVHALPCAPTGTTGGPVKTPQAETRNRSSVTQTGRCCTGHLLMPVVVNATLTKDATLIEHLAEVQGRTIDAHAIVP